MENREYGDFSIGPLQAEIYNQDRWPRGRVMAMAMIVLI